MKTLRAANGRNSLSEKAEYKPANSRQTFPMTLVVAAGRHLDFQRSEQ
jgi:hypothetical protein